MACFAVPAVEAIVVTAAYCAVKAKENKKMSLESGVEKKDLPSESVKSVKVAFSKKLSWLAYLLWGGSFLLAFEHLWHGEIQPFFPFLTATVTPEGTAEMLGEMATVGVGMSVLVTLVWVGMLVAARAIVNRSAKQQKVEDNA